MKINDSKGIIINSKDISIHDDILNQLLFDRTKCEILLLITKSNNMNNEYAIKFVNVVGFEMTSCNFWGISPHILDFEYVEYENRTLLPKLHYIKESSEIHHLCKLVTNINYIETIITFTSGDKLTIACEYIII